MFFSTKKLRIVARFEMKTLLRSWFFRIFAGLSIVGLGIFNIAVFVEASGAPWMYRAMPACIPYANLIILNLGQAIVAVFLASEFLKQDRKNDTIEVIYARSMTNAEYILGKSLGILYVFLILNIIILGMGIGFSFLSSDSSQGVGELFLYPLLISIPTLVFILGLSFSLMLIFRNQAVTFIVLLGYIALTIFYLNTKVYHLFDYIAYQVPMLSSTITGFGNFEEVLIHRGIYFFLGLGMIFLTIFKLQRLPQAKRMTSFPLYLGILCILAGAWLIYDYLDLKTGTIRFKKELIELNNKYVDYPVMNVASNNIDIQHLGKKIRVVSDMTAVNNTSYSLDTLIFSLNPSLLITEASIEGVQTEYDKEMQIIRLFPEQEILPGEQRRITLTYEGSIDERIHFLDQDMENYEDNFNLEIFRVRKRYSFLEDDFVCFTSGALWYPISGTGYSTDNPVRYKPDFTQFSLKVSISGDLTAISQGSVSLDEQGNYLFTNEYPLPKISLLIGDYGKHSIIVDSIEYGIYALRGNEFFTQHFQDLQDSLPAHIRTLKNEYESAIELEYPFKRFFLAEVPVHFALDKHIYSLSSDAVQPEIMLYPEMGVTLEETDFKKRKKRYERRMKRDNEEISEEELQERMFKRFVRGNYMANYREWYLYDNIMDRNTFTLFPNYYDFIMRLESPEWPVLNMSLGVYLKERNSNPVSVYRWWFTRISKNERINLALKKASLKDLMESEIAESDEDLDEDEKVRLRDVILAKGDHLFSVFRARYGSDEFNKSLNSFIINNQHKVFDFKALEKYLEESFGHAVTEEINRWYSEKTLPGFLVKDIRTYKVVEGEYTKYQIRFRISNPEPVDGLVTLLVDLSNRRVRNADNQELPDFSKKIYLPANSAKEVGYVFTTEPRRMSIYTHVSENLPNTIAYDFEAFSEIRKTKAFEGIRENDLFSDVIQSGEIIVDNEEDGFEFIQQTNKSYLKSLIDKNREQSNDYVGIRWWNPPAVWKPVLRSGFYGKYVRSAFYTKSGEAERTASWKAPITDAAYYDVYCHIEKMNIRSRRYRKQPSYNFIIHHEGGTEEITMTDEELELGWNYLGTFFITPETAKVEMTNKSAGGMVFADAIKWIENK